MAQSNLPPGVTESMIPGNRPEDVDWDNLWDWIACTSIGPEALRGLVIGWCKRNDKMPKQPPPRFHMEGAP
jgi:hypothetical protein